MTPLSRRSLLLLGSSALLAGLLPGSAVAAPPPEYEAIGGYFFGHAADGKGFGVSDADGVEIWSTFHGLGGADALGLPISRRFIWRGRVTQVFQRAILQHEPMEKSVALLNVMDLLHEAGFDPWLQRNRAVPVQLPPTFDIGKPGWPAIVAARQELLDVEPLLRDTYFAYADPVALLGLPTSAVQDLGSHVAIRTQRAVLQLWKHDTAWAPAGTVTAALVGEVARDAGLFRLGVSDVPTAAAFTPEVAWPVKPAPPPPKPELPAVQRPAAIGAAERWIDVDVSRQWVSALEGDQIVFGAPATTGKAGFTTPLGTFAIFSRVFNETMDSATLGTPRNHPEGYYLKDIFFTQYFLGGGYALHTNYWQPESVFGNRATSHGCVGLRQADAEFLWSFATFGTKVHVHR